MEYKRNKARQIQEQVHQGVVSSPLVVLFSCSSPYLVTREEMAKMSINRILLGFLGWSVCPGDLFHEACIVKIR